MNRDSYNAIAAEWDEARRAFFGRERAYLDALLEGLPTPARILDAGCGTGRPMAEYLVARGHVVVGIDQAERLIEIARRRFPAHQWIHASLEDYEPRGRYHAVLCWDALFHLPRESHEKILGRLIACLEPGGRLMLTVGGSEHPPFVDSMFGHQFFYDSHTPERTASMLADLGLSILIGEFMNEPTGGRDKGRYAIVAQSSSRGVRGTASAVQSPVMSDKTVRFHHLHESGCFVIPNPWDPGSAKLLAGLGFPALATTSSGFAWTQGRPDNHVTLDEALAHFRIIAAAVDVPVSGDFEGGFAVEPERVADNVTRAVHTGVAGLSIEDSSGDPQSPLFEFTLAVDRVRAARRAIDASGTGVLLTARTEGFIAGRPDLAETLRRVRAYAEAGADCLYAPGIRSLSDIAAVVHTADPRPVNVLVGSDFATVAQLAELGVRRISVGGALARAAWTGLLAAAKEIARDGTFTGLAHAVPFAEFNGMFPAGRDQ